GFAFLGRADRDQGVHAGGVQGGADPATALQQQAIQFGDGGGAELHQVQVQRGRVVHQRVDAVQARVGRGVVGRGGGAHDHLVSAGGEEVDHRIAGGHIGSAQGQCADQRAALLQTVLGLV